MPSETNKIGLPQLRYAIELMCAGTNPIKPEQLEAFCRHPGGPILPEQCVESQRLAREPNDYIPELLGVMPKGAVVLRRYGGCGYSVGDELHMLEPGMTGVSLCGFDLQGRPIMLASAGAIVIDGKIRYLDPELSDVFVLPKGRILVGKRRVAQETLMLGELHLGDDSGALVMPLKERLILSSKMVSIYKSHLGMDPALYVCSGHTLYDVTGGQYVPLEHPSSIVEYCGKPWLLDHAVSAMHPLQEVFFRASAGQFYRNAERVDLGLNPYLGGFCPLGSWFAYVGQSLRHKLECWVRAGEAQPAFERVTRELFEQDGKHYYYGQIGQHLYKMELPV